MKLAVISDTHFGDSNSVLVDYDEDNGWHLNHTFYDKFKKCLDLNDTSKSEYKYLVILGDVFDLAVSNYDNTYKAAKPFFKQLATDKIFEEIIIVTGNHDHALWSNLQYMENIVEKIKNEDDPQMMEWSIPGILDNRKNELVLDGNSYKDTFLNDLTTPAIKFHIMSPNLYLLDKEKTVLLTHGQFFDFPWACLGLIARILFPTELNKVPLLKLQHILGDNFALNQLMCSGLGQSEINFTRIIQELEHKLAHGEYKEAAEYNRNILMAKMAEEKELDRLTKKILLIIINFIFSSKIITRDTDFSIVALKEEISDSLEASEANKNSDMIDETFGFLNEHFKRMEEKIPRFVKSFRDASQAELNRLVQNEIKDNEIKDIDHLIFGHTHRPKEWTEKVDWSKPHTAPNTGAWLFKNKSKEKLCGANVFIYDAESLAITCKTLPSD